MTTKSSRRGFAGNGTVFILIVLVYPNLLCVKTHRNWTHSSFTVSKNKYKIKKTCTGLLAIHRFKTMLLGKF